MPTSCAPSNPPPPSTNAIFIFCRLLALSEAAGPRGLPGAQAVANRNWLRTVAKGEAPNALGGDGLGLDRVEDGDGVRHSDGSATVDGGGTAVLADPERRGGGGP